MCRFLAYCGEPVLLETLVCTPCHSLIEQSMRASEAKTETNGDGFGVGWYSERPEPGRYCEIRPAWSDENLQSICGHVRSHLFFAHVRAATGTAVSRANCHPFKAGRFLFMHNGQVGDWTRLRRKVEAMIPDHLYATRTGTTDSEAIFLAALGHGLEEDSVGAFQTVLHAIRDEMVTLGIAAYMKNKGRVVACDVLEKRLKRATERFRRAGLHNIEAHPLTSERDPWVKRHKRKFDRVLVDAPCSGTGTWRRNPDARWRQLGPGLEQLLPLQANILDSAARLVKPGGRLIYATCSMLHDENEGQVEAFLQTHPDFTVKPIAEVWAEEEAGTPPVDGPYLRLSPARHDTDGFFAAVLDRKAEESVPTAEAGEETGEGAGLEEVDPIELAKAIDA